MDYYRTANKNRTKKKCCSNKRKTQPQNMMLDLLYFKMFRLTFQGNYCDAQKRNFLFDVVWILTSWFTKLLQTSSVTTCNKRNEYIFKTCLFQSTNQSFNGTLKWITTFHCVKSKKVAEDRNCLHGTSLACLFFVLLYDLSAVKVVPATGKPRMSSNSQLKPLFLFTLIRVTCSAKPSFSTGLFKK